MESANQEHSVLVSVSIENGRVLSKSETSMVQIAGQIEFLKQKLNERVNNARLIAESNKEMFLPYNVNSFIKETTPS